MGKPRKLSSKKTICIDLRPLETGNKYRGFGYYIYNLALNILKDHPKDDYIFLLYSAENPLFKLIKSKGYRAVFIAKPKVRPRFWWLVDQYVLNKTVRALSPDVFVSFDTSLPLFLTFQKKIKTIAAIPDLIPLIMKKEYAFPSDLKLSYWWRFWAAKRADLIITISVYSKKDIHRYLKVPVEKIETIYLAVSDDFKPINRFAIAKIKRKYSQDKKFFLVVGDFYGIDPRKNYLFVLGCFAEIIKKSKFKNHLLLFVGKSGGIKSEYCRILARAQEIGIQKNILFTDFVSQKDLVKLFGAAEIFFFPTQYEGFGLPILQAMACGTPVIAADNTSIPEVAGKAAALHLTGSKKDFLKRFDAVIKNRQRFIKAGLANVKRFSWEKCAKETLVAIERVASL